MQAIFTSRTTLTSLLWLKSPAIYHILLVSLLLELNQLISVYAANVNPLVVQTSTNPSLDINLMVKDKSANHQHLISLVKNRQVYDTPFIAQNQPRQGTLSREPHSSQNIQSNVPLLEDKENSPKLISTNLSQQSDILSEGSGKGPITHSHQKTKFDDTEEGEDDDDDDDYDYKDALDIGSGQGISQADKTKQHGQLSANTNSNLQKVPSVEDDKYLPYRPNTILNAKTTTTPYPTTTMQTIKYTMPNLDTATYSPKNETSSNQLNSSKQQSTTSSYLETTQTATSQKTSTLLTTDTTPAQPMETTTSTHRPPTTRESSPSFSTNSPLEAQYFINQTKQTTHQSNSRPNEYIQLSTEPSFFFNGNKSKVETTNSSYSFKPSSSKGIDYDYEDENEDEDSEDASNFEDTEFPEGESLNKTTTNISNFANSSTFVQPEVTTTTATTTLKPTNPATDVNSQLFPILSNSRPTKAPVTYSSSTTQADFKYPLPDSRLITSSPNSTLYPSSTPATNGDNFEEEEEEEEEDVEEEEEEEEDEEEEDVIDEEHSVEEFPKRAQNQNGLPINTFPPMTPSWFPYKQPVQTRPQIQEFFGGNSRPPIGPDKIPSEHLTPFFTPTEHPTTTMRPTTTLTPIRIPITSSAPTTTPAPTTLRTIISPPTLPPIMTTTSMQIPTMKVTNFFQTTLAPVQTSTMIRTTNMRATPPPLTTPNSIERARNLQPIARFPTSIPYDRGVYDEETGLTRQIYDKAVEIYHATNEAIDSAVEAMATFEFSKKTFEPLLADTVLFMFGLGAFVMILVLSMMLVVHIINKKIQPDIQDDISIY